MARQCPIPPFSPSHQLNWELGDAASRPFVPSPARSLPGYPHIPLQERRHVWAVLESDFCSDALDRVAGRLWWMSKQDSGNVSPLHRQLVKRRSVVVTEDPKLHLTWIHHRIFVKPLPRYVLAYPFWQGYLCGDHPDDVHQPRARVRLAILGYLRTYAHLVRYECDFRIAQDPTLQLIPPDVTWAQFCHFRADLARIGDGSVAPRYHYGELRLTRLNFYAPLLLGQSHFQRVDYQYSAYFAHFYGPVLFVIGVISIILSGFQVAVAVDLAGINRQALSFVALWFSVTVMVCIWAVLCALFFLLLYRIAKEWRVAIRDRVRLSAGRRKAETGLAA